MCVQTFAKLGKRHEDINLLEKKEIITVDNIWPKPNTIYSFIQFERQRNKEREERKREFTGLLSVREEAKIQSVSHTGLEGLNYLKHHLFLAKCVLAGKWGRSKARN